MEALHEASVVVVRDCMGIQDTETALILTDEPCCGIGKALFDICKDYSKEAFLVEMYSQKDQW